MPEVAECLNRRYRALDELITELSALHKHGSGEDNLFSRRNYDPGIKLMCDFWNILKEDPDCDLSHAVKQRMGVPVQSQPSMFAQSFQCYMTGSQRGCGPGRAGGRGGSDPRKDINRIREICCGTNSFTRSATARDCRVTCGPDAEVKKSDNSMPLSKALCNLKEAASFDKKCNIRISALMETQKELKAQIQNLEQREKDGINLLREADSMWSNMEGEYKNKIALSIERQKMLMKQLKEVETSQSKWRRTKKELEDELKYVMKSRQEIGEKINQKNNDIRCMELEIADFTRRISTNKRSIDGSKQALVYKKTASDKKVAKYNEEMKKLKATLAEVQKHKKEKEAEGKRYVADARDDLQNICKVLLQKKLENEDLVAEKEAILQEINLLKQTCDQCKDKCENKRKNIEDEIKKVDKCIADYKYQCIQCHECTDTNDARRLCSDCPKCKEKRECITAGDHCDRDKSYDCICVIVKEKFLNNVFENMYTVLERQTKTRPGKALADKIVKCLKNSRNGKLNCETRDQVKTFVLNVLKKNLNLTIVGGAVKTRCELDADAYQKLMNCVNLVKTDKPFKEDKGTVVKKESCARWGVTSECHCPGGPAYCACSRKAPPPPEEPKACPDTGKDKPPEPGQVLCPHKETISCGPECAMIPPPPRSEAVVPTKANKVCSTSGCPFAKNMRTAQCVLGPESLSSLPKAHTQSTPIVPGASTIDKTIFKSVSVGKSSGKTRKASTRPREKIIEEVMGRYTEITPIDKVTTGGQCINETISGENINQRSIDAKQLKADTKNNICDCSENNQISMSFNDSLLVKKNVGLTNISVSSQISGKTRDFFDYGENLENVKESNIPLKQKEISKYKPAFADEIHQSNNSSNIPATSQNIDVDLNKLLDDLVKNSTKTSEDTVKNHIIETQNQTALKEAEPVKPLIAPDSPKYHKTSSTPVSIIHQSILLLSDLQQKYENKESIDIKLETDSGLYTINSPVTKTISGNLAVNVKILRGKLFLKYRENPIVIRRSDSGAIILDQNSDSFCNALIRKTTTGAILLVIPNSSNESKNKSKQTTNPAISPTAADVIFKVKIESDDFDTNLPPAVLKKTPSQNMVFIPDKEFESTYNKKVQQVLDDKSEYYVHLTKTDSKNAVLRVDDSWDEHKPNAVLMKSNSGNIKIQEKENVAAPDHKLERSSIVNSSKVLGEIIGATPRKTNTESRRILVFPKRPMLKTKSSSDANVYEKVKLMYSKDKNLFTNPPAILKLTKSGQYAVILGKESKTTFMKNLRTYLKNNIHGLVPIKKTDTGEITISLNDDHPNKNNYGSLKITTSGNMFVIVDKEVVKGIEAYDETESSSRDSLNEVASRHIIGKLKNPVNIAVATTCSARPDMECDGSQCACADFKLPKLQWIYNSQKQSQSINYYVESEVSGLTWNKVTSGACKIVGIYKNVLNSKYTECSDNGLSRNDTPRIVIKTCASDLYENFSNGSGSDTSDDVENDRDNWDSLKFLPPQLPEFLKNLNYR